MPISPNQGSTGGGTLVAITGTNLANVSKVFLPCTRATAPANPGSPAVIVQRGCRLDDSTPPRR
ncbi:IPT/TIG domain-containing protein [Streptomyces sp. NPDC096012]|uniref:IPT/TIG domain-containing protein n=1 Tax=Streptomyces sp. NPDC096012 TaxID=3155684 RepID=UPI00336AEABB